jgi:soluble lytic murein transglycosylase-like protein
VEYGVRKGIPAGIVVRLMIAESGGRPWAVSSKTAEGYQSRGLFQLYDKPEHMQWLLERYWKREKVFDVYDPVDNAIVALSYLADLYKRFGSWYLALCWYNAGRVYAVPESTRRYAVWIVGGVDVCQRK